MAPSSLYSRGGGVDEDALVEAVLSEWFDGSLQELHRNKWFATAAARNAIDARIAERFGDRRVVLRRRTPRRGSPRARGVAAHARGVLAAVVLLDQFSRHIARAAPRLSDGSRGDTAVGQAACDAAARLAMERFLATWDPASQVSEQRPAASAIGRRPPSPCTLSNPPATAHRASSRVLAHADAARRRRPRRKRDAPRRPPPMPRARRRASDGTD